MNRKTLLMIKQNHKMLVDIAGALAAINKFGISESDSKTLLNDAIEFGK